MFSAKSFRITPEEYRYLLPAPIKGKLLNSLGSYFLITENIEDLTDCLSRLKGYYEDFSDDINAMIIYRCSTNGNLKEFRDQYLK